jgi:transposase
MVPALQGDGPIANLFWLTDAQTARLQPFFAKSHRKARADEQRVLGGIICSNRNGLRWRDVPREYGPPKTLYNRWKQWSEKGAFARMMVGLLTKAATPKTVMIDVSRHAPLVRVCLGKYLKPHSTATSLQPKKGNLATKGAV